MIPRILRVPLAFGFCLGGGTLCAPAIPCDWWKGTLAGLGVLLFLAGKKCLIKNY